ncbi:MAG: hypothetical protein JXA69_15225 [Phycisphaerae bacterium]|nr:hypothetical protein [Phycisphaerae bacterium]
MRKLAVLGATLVILTSWATTVGAATVTVYTDKTEWENAVGGQFLTEGFANSQLNPGVSFVSTESGHINPTLECYQDVLASGSQNEPMTTWSFVPEITGYGGNWTLGGPGGSGNSLLVYIADLSLYVGTIPNSYGGGFWGFTSDTPFTSVRLIGGGGTNQQNYCLDDMVYSRPNITPCFTPQQDSDGDGDVDLADFGQFSACFNGPNRPYASPELVCTCLDFASDLDVDLVDFSIFASCFNGPNRSPACP